jgi:hypothetical protein
MIEYKHFTVQYILSVGIYLKQELDFTQPNYI